MCLTRHLETANRTIEELRQQLDELQTAKQNETQLQQQITDESIGTGIRRSDALALLELKAPVGDMLYAFLSYTLTSNQQVILLDSLLSKNIITVSEYVEIQKLTTVEEKVMMLLSRLKRISVDKTKYWLSAISDVGQKQLAEAKLRTFCKYDVSL